MTTPTDAQTIQSGARRVEETEHLASGLTEPRDVSIAELTPEERAQAGSDPLKTTLGDVTLSMFVQGSSTRVRVGNAHNASELYEHAFESTEDANDAMLDAGILTKDQVSDRTQPAGTGISLSGITVEQLEAAGLKRHGASTI
jgi:hypothetical protein